MIKKMNIAFIATLALLSTLYSCKKETTTNTNTELTVGPLELVEGSLNVSGANFKVAINDPASVASKKKLCYSPTVQSPTIDTAGKATGEQTYVIDMGTNLSAIVLMGLSMGKTYYVRAAVVTKSGAIVYSSNVLKIITKTETAGTLSVVGQPGYDVVVLSATAASNGATEGTVYYSDNDNLTMGSPHKDIQNQGVQLMDLTPGTKYYAQIWIKTASGEIITGPKMSFTTKAYTIGQDYKGGIIFYINDKKDHGLIVAKKDIGEGEMEMDKIIFPWGLYRQDVTIDNADGLSNTNAIITAINNPAISDQTAAGQCKGYKPADQGSFQTDWYLPSLEEFQLLAAANPTLPINLYTGIYWLSTADVEDNQYALTVEYKGGMYIFGGNNFRDRKARVRAIHTF